MSLWISEETFLKLSETLLSAGYEIESIKCVHKSALADNSRGFFNGMVLCIYRKSVFLRFFSKPLPKKSLLKIVKSLSSNGFDVNSIESFRKPSGFKGIKLRIFN